MSLWNTKLFPHLGENDPRFASRVSFAALLFSALYLSSNVIELLQGGFSNPQLALTLVGEAAVPFFVVGLYRVHRPKIGRLGLVSALAYAYSYVFFTATVVYAIMYSTRDYAELTTDLGPVMTVHGGIMVVAGLGFGAAVVRAGVLPAWAGIRAAGFGGMGLALLLAARAGNRRQPRVPRMSAN